MTTTKTCTQCRTDKPLTEFYKSVGAGGARLSTCKSCYAVAHASKPQTDHRPNSSGCFQPAPLPHTAATGGPDWTPLKPSDLPQPVLRPGALDHERYGSRQADGSVKPYRAPIHGCVGYLKETALALTPVNIDKHKKQHHAH